MVFVNIFAILGFVKTKVYHSKAYTFSLHVDNEPGVSTLFFLSEMTDFVKTAE